MPVLGGDLCDEVSGCDLSSTVDSTLATARDMPVSGDDLCFFLI